MLKFEITEGYYGNCARCMSVEDLGDDNSNKVFEEFPVDDDVVVDMWMSAGLGDPPLGAWVRVCDSCLEENDIVDEVTE